MAQGSVITGTAQAAAGTTNWIAIQPTAGVEWIVVNIYYDQACAIRVVNGTTEIEFDSDTGAGSMQQRSFHLNNGQYLKIRNNQATNVLNVTWDGVSNT